LKAMSKTAVNPRASIEAFRYKSAFRSSSIGAGADATTIAT
jgi:hypothetical protein